MLIDKEVIYKKWVYHNNISRTESVELAVFRMETKHKIIYSVCNDHMQVRSEVCITVHVS